MIRDHGRVRCFTLGTIHQLAVTALVACCMLWALLATAAWVDASVTLAAREDDISRRVSEIDGVKADYQAAFGRLDQFQSIFSSITCEVSDIQDSLLRIAERGGPAPVAKRGAGPASAPLPKLDPQAGSGCRTIAKAKTPLPPDAVAASPDQAVVIQRVADLEEKLELLKASHGAFLEHSADITAMRFGELERTLAKVGIDAKTLVPNSPITGQASASVDKHYGSGGPFVAAPSGSASAFVLTPVALFNSHAQRLETLNIALVALPLAEPLTEYEVTSPFGVRNDPINTMSGIHEGMDMGAPVGTPVRSTGNGKVVISAWKDRYGFLVEIDHGMGLHTRYGHLSKLLVAEGDKVQRGTPIGLLGATGRTTGPHLHYEVRVDGEATNPLKFITAGRDVLKVQ